jgi:peptidoglycan hydrolase-like protein with peptidoglycan-binding domain
MAALIMAATLVAAACNDDDGGVTTTLPVTTTSTVATTTTTSAPVETTTTTTLPPTGPPLAVEGDENEIVEAMQFLLNCNGAELVVDGDFGPASLAALESAQTALGVQATGIFDESTIAVLSRNCLETRTVEVADEPVVIVGNAVEGDSETLAISLLSREVLSVSTVADVTVTLVDLQGQEIAPTGAGDQWEIDAAGDYLILVSAGEEAVTFSLEIDVADGSLGEWIIGTDRLVFGDVELAHGDDAQTVIDAVIEILGHDVRGAYDEFDTDWYVITDPQELGLRGVFIEGFAFLFFGPSPGDPGRAETFVRHRFEGPSDDAEGNPRPENYATTSEGITVGDTLTDLEAAYGGDVSPGSNSDEYYYRYTDSRGELCFYFGADEPSASSPIVEIASECRVG